MEILTLLNSLRLEVPITLTELKNSLVLMPKAKSLRSDGIPPELIMVLWDLVGSVILDSVNFSLAIEGFHWDQKFSLISLLIKKG